MKPRLLALDMAGDTGACHSDGSIWQWTLAYKSDDNRATRLERLYDYVTGTHFDHPFDYLGTEESAFGSPNGRVKALHNEYLGVLKLAGCKLGIPPVFLYKPKTIKKFATGSGNASKDDMVAAAYKQLKIKTDSYDVADALWVLQLMKQELWQ